MRDLIKKSFGFFSVTALFVMIALSVSCEIGLGAAVDTEPPVLNIETPVSDSIVRDAFRMAGTWSDDGTVSGVEVELESPDGTSSYGPFEGTVIESEDENVANTWYCVIDPKVNGIPDGSYDVKVSISDEGGHTTIQSRLFVIDNTAPIIVLQRPSSKAADSAPDSYGQTFTLEGQAADDNNVSLIRVNIYSDAECTNLVHYVDLTNVPPTISLDVAKFGDDNYTKIYGSSGKDGAKQFYCTISGYDGAVRYPADGSAQTPADLLGNAVSSYYLYEDIASTVLAQNKITDIYHMFNGAYLKADSNRSAETVNSVISALSGSVVVQGRFSLNPENNPTFVVSGKELEKGKKNFSNSNYDITNGASVVIEVSPGLDGIPLNRETLKVYGIQCDENGNVISGVSKIYPSETKDTKNGSSQKFVSVIRKEDGFVVGNNYLFGVDGTDQSGNPVVPNSNAYGFHMTSNGAAPKYENIIPAGAYLYNKAGDSITLSGDFITDDGQPYVSIKLGTTEFEVANVTKTGSERYHFEYTLDKEKFSQTESGQYDLKIYARTEGDVEIQKYVMYDVKEPEVAIDEVTPEAAKYEKNDTTGNYSLKDSNKYLNGVVTIKTSITDSFDIVSLDAGKAPVLEIAKKDGPDKVQYSLVENGTLKRSISIDTTDSRLTGFGNVTISVIAQDRAGNIGSDSKDYIIDQSTDDPVILLPEKMQFNMTDKSVIENDANELNLVAANSQVEFSLIDDDGIKEFKVYKLSAEIDGVTKDKTLAEVKELNEYKTATAETGIDNTGRFYPSTTAGLYWFWFKLIDKNNKEITTEPALIQITAAAPTITKVTSKAYVKGINGAADEEIASGYTSTNGYFKNTIEINSDLGPFEVWRKIESKDSDFVNITSNVDRTNVNKPVDTVDLTTLGITGDVIVQYKVKDKKSHWSTNNGEVTCLVDNVKPVITITSASPTVYATTNTFMGIARDTLSGVKKVEVSFKSDHSDVKDAASNGWYYESTFASELSGTGLPEGSNKFYVRATDNVGNVSDWIEQTFTYDKAVPVVEVKLNDSILADESEQVKTSAYTFKYKATDTWGIKETNGVTITVTKNGTGVTATTGTVDGNGFIPVSLPADSGDGLFKYTIVAEDKAGKTTTVNRTIRLDTKGPVVTVSTPNFTDWNMDSSIGVYGTAKDDSGVKAVYYYFDRTGTAAKPAIPADGNWVSKGWTATSGTDNWNFTLDNVPEGDTAKLYIAAEDKNGITVTSTEIIEKTVKMDLSKPELTVDSDSVLQYMPTSGFTITGKVKDTNKLAATQALKITQTFTPDSGSVSTATTYVTSVNGKSGLNNWSQVVPFVDGTGAQASVTSDGVYEFKFDLVDAAGKHNTSTGEEYKSTVDTTAPSNIVISAPSGKTKKNAISETNYRFEGTLTEKYTVAAVWYMIFTRADVNAATAPAPSKPASGQSALLASSWTGWTAGSKGKSWNFYQDFKAKNAAGTALPEGSYTVHIAAVDGAGNVSNINSVDFDVDLKAPEIETKVDTTDITDNSKVTKTSAYSFKYKVTETNGISSETLTVKKDGTGLSKVTAGSGNGYSVNEVSGYKVITIEGSAAGDGLFEYTIDVTDIATKNTKVVRNIQLDTTPPVISVVSPTLDASTYQNSGAFIVNGSASDASGVAKVYYQYLADNSSAPATTSWAAWNEATNTTSWKITTGANGISGADGDSKLLWVAAEDTNGLKSVPVSFPVKFDLNKPNVSVKLKRATDADAGLVTTLNTNATFVLKGTVSDANGIKNLTISDGTNTYTTSTTPAIQLAQGSTLAGAKTSTNWTLTIPVTKPQASGELADGKYTFTVTAVDMADKDSSSNVAVVIDRIAPSTNTGTITSPSSSATYNSRTWYKSKDITLKVTTSDESTASGINKVYYTTEAMPVDPATAWTAMEQRSDGWYTTLANLAEGKHTIYYKVVDNAGNANVTPGTGANAGKETANSTPTIFNIDVTAPNTVSFSKAELVQGGEYTTITASFTNPITVNKRNNIRLTFTADDEDSADAEKTTGIKAITLKNIGTNTTITSDAPVYDSTNKNYTMVIKSADLASGSVNIRIEDNAGNINDITTPVQFNVDTSRPTVSTIKPSSYVKAETAKYTVNGKIKVSGTASDNKLNSVDVCYWDSANTKWVNKAHITDSNKLSEWTTGDIDTTSLTDGEYKFVIIAIDEAGNCNLDTGTTPSITTQHKWDSTNNCYIPSTTDGSITNTDAVITLKVDQDTDRPVIRFITPNSISGMTTATPIWLKNTSTVIGMISDDDSSDKVVTSFEYSKKCVFTNDSVEPADWSKHYKDPDCKTAAGTFKAGTYYKWESLGTDSSFQFDVDDGSQEIYFKVKDNAGKTFTSGNTANNSLAEVKFTDGTNAINSSAILSMKVDKTSPHIDSSNIKYDVFDSTAKSGVGAYTGNLVKNSSIYSYGGNNNKVKITVPASDENAIASVKATITKADSTTTVISGTCNDASYNDVAEHTWTITDIPLTGTVGQAVIEIEVIDGAGLKSSEKITLPVDNTAPTVSVSAPKATAISSDKVTAYGTLTELCSALKFAVTPDPSDTHPVLDGSTKATTWNGYTIQDDSSLKALTAAEKSSINYSVTYQDIVGSSLSWYIYFNGETATDRETNTAKLENWLDEDHIGITTKAALTAQNNAFDKIVDLYLWIYAKDEAGNESYTKHTIKVDPQGGRPSVTIDYPEAGSAIGGTIRLSGSAEDNGTVESVWVQIISGAHVKDLQAASKTFGSGSHDSNKDVTAFNLKATDVTYMQRTGTVSLISNAVTPTAWNTENADTEASKYGIKANLSGSSWNLKINTNQEFKPSGTTNDVYIRVYALDNENKWSYSTTKFFQIDSSRPVIGDVMLKQYASGTSAANILSGTATPVAEKEYTAGDYLNGKNGNWYVTFTAEDDNQIGSLVVEDEQGNETTLSENTHYKLSTVKSGKTNDKVTVAYPLTPTGNVYSWNIKIKVNDTNSPVNTSTQSIELNYDNLNPKLRRPGSSNEYSISPVIKQTNGFYTIKSQIDESSATGTQSGLKAVAFYFLRRNAVDDTVYVMDPMQVRAGNVQVKNAKTLGAVGAGTVVYDSGLYWLKRAITRDTNSYNTFTYTSASTSDEKSIHVGGLVQIGGTLYTITSVSGTTVIVDKNIPNQATGYFALGMVVDTAVEKYSGTKNTDGYYDTWAAGDGDRMYESMGGTTANRTWEAQISAKNISDGPVELHYVAFDNAGNYSIGIVGNKAWNTYKGAANLFATADVNEVKTKTPGTTEDYVDFIYADSEACYVKNNAPRISSVTVGCDYDGSGTIGDKTNETKTYYYNKVEGKNKAGGVTAELVVDSGSEAFMKLTDESSIAMEIIGGNGNLYYSYSIDGATKTVTGANTTTLGAGNYDGEESNYLTNGEVSVDAAHTKTINLSLSDFNNYLDKGTGNGSANTAYIANNTSTKPLTTFEYTIWDSTDGEKVAGENTLDTWSTQYAKMTVKLDVQVHDETAPKMVIDDFTASHFAAATGHIDLPSNLPGATFTGTTGQFDKDPKVSGKIKVTGYAYDNIRLESLWLKATDFTFTPTTALPSGTNRTASDGYVQVAKFASGTWTGTANATAGWSFTVSDSADDGAYQNDTGHKVMWTLELDTTKVSNAAGADKTISVYAKDVRGTDSTTTSGLYSSNDSASATVGSEDSTWNKPNYRVDVVPYITGVSRPSGTETKRSKLGKYQVVIGESLAVTGFNLPTGDTYYRVTTENKTSTTAPTTKITSASRTATGATLTAPGNSGYVVAVTNSIVSLNNMNSGNEQEGVNSDDAWTDDVYLNCWKNDEYFHFSNDPISPAMDRVPAGVAGKTLHKLYGGWATNGSKFYASYASSVKDTTNTSSGNAPSPANGGGTGKTSNEFGDPATFYDVVIDASGNRYNILLDCWQGSTNGWGRNFVINKNGYYSHKGCSTSFDNSNTLSHVIERMGKGGVAPDNADSSDGFDEMFNQFLNPRIAIYNGVAYLSYYDRYAKCLKYAASQPNDNTNAPTLKFATEGIYTSSTYRSNDDADNKSGNYKNGACVVAGYDTLVSGGSPTRLDVGLWSAVGVDTGSSAPVIAYYDATNKKLMIATGKDAGNKTIAGHTTSAQAISYPLNSNTPVYTSASSTPSEGNAWTRTEVTGSAALKLGQYVSMVVDSSNNLHIACYGTAGGNKLYYVKGTRTAYGSYTFTTTCVDPNGAGTWTDIQLENNKPVISYYDPSNDSSEHAVKVAYLDGDVWDTMTAPLGSSATSNRITLALNVTDGASLSTATANNSKLAVGYVSSRFDCIYLRKE